MDSIRHLLGSNRIVPVVKIEDAARAVDLQAALVDAGITIIEITFRTDAAAAAIEACRASAGSMVVGAGTVRTIEQVDRAIDAGAEFLVAPGFSRTITEYALKKGVPHIPGTITPTEVEMATELGLDVLKFFPAEQAGGPGFLKSLGAVYPGIGFMPTGGVNAGNIKDYLALPNVLACGGSWMVKPEWINAGEFGVIRKTAAEALKAISQTES